MSHYPRGVYLGVVHYCDNSWRPNKDAEGRFVLLPWCLLDLARHDTARVSCANPPPRKREPVTCLLCMRLRRIRRR